VSKDTCASADHCQRKRNCFLPGNASAVHLRGFGTFAIVADASCLIVLPVAGGQGGAPILLTCGGIRIAVKLSSIQDDKSAKGK